MPRDGFAYKDEVMKDAYSQDHGHDMNRCLLRSGVGSREVCVYV